jgi:hypothetical protein
MLFGASFRANGNLLSQWRGYSVHGKGVSLGFDPAEIANARRPRASPWAAASTTRTSRQRSSKRSSTASRAGPGERQQTPRGELQRPVRSIEEDMLRIAAVLKHPAFEEEQEWRIVSPVIDSCWPPAVHFREGCFDARAPTTPSPRQNDESGGISLNHVFIGPTANADLSMHSLRLYLRATACDAQRDGISYCQIPYRKR